MTAIPPAAEPRGIELRYEAPGPVAEAFMASTAPVQAILGPQGSGKTGANLMKHVFNACAQRQSTHDGKRKYRVCVVRDTYRQLWQSTIRSWHSWIPKEAGTWTGEKDGPATHVIRFRLADKSLVELTVDFVAIGEHKVEDVLRGYEVTGFYLNEADLLHEEVFTYAKGRAGRFPTMREGGPSWFGVTLDFNAPDTDSWIYERFFGDRPAGFEVFVQPSGMSPQAENIKNLPPGYYETQAIGQPEWWINRMIHAKFGASRAGKPVYPEFNDRRHMALAPIVFVAALPLRIGLDAGGHPAGAIFQHMPNGQWRWLYELCGEQGTGPRRFSDDLNRLLKDECPGIKRDRVDTYADPSAAYGADKKAGEDNWIEIVEKGTGLRIRAAPTNKETPRLEALRRPLVATIDGTEPGLIVSPKCRTVRKGFNSGYRYRLMNIPGERRYSAEPEKNEFSHPLEAGQYALLGGDGYADVMGRQRQASTAKRQETAISDDDYAQMTRGFNGGNRGKSTQALDE